MERQSPPEANAEVEVTDSYAVNISNLPFSQAIAFSS